MLFLRVQLDSIYTYNLHRTPCKETFTGAYVRNRCTINNIYTLFRPLLFIDVNTTILLCYAQNTIE